MINGGPQHCGPPEARPKEKKLAKRDYRTDRVYVYKGWDAPVFVTPDGIGRVFYNSIEEAQEETGVEAVTYLDYEYESWDSGDYDPDEEAEEAWRH